MRKLRGYCNDKKVEVRVYGTVAGEKRIFRSGHYYSVTGDKYGHFKTMWRWSPKRSNVKTIHRIGGRC